MRILTHIASAFKALLSPASDRQRARESYDADLNQMGWEDPRRRVESCATASQTGLYGRPGSASSGDARATHPAGRRDAANRRRIETQSVNKLKDDEKNLALALAQSEIALDAHFKKSEIYFDIQLGAPRGPKTRDEKIAAVLASSAIELDPKLKGRGVQFDVRTLPRRVPTSEEKDLALALAISAIEHDAELSNAGMKFNVSIGPLRTPMTESESLAHSLALSAIENELSLKNSGLQIQVSLRPSPE